MKEGDQLGREGTGFVLFALSGAAGAAGLAAFDAGPIFYFVPLGLSLAGIVLFIAAGATGARVSTVLMALCAVAVIGSGFVGIIKYSDFRDIQDASERETSKVTTEEYMQDLVP